MSSGYVVVRFPDGEIRHGIYHGTSDLMCPLLFADIDQASAYYDAQRGRVPMPEQDGERGPEVDVEFWATYGGDFGWKGRATRHEVAAASCAPYGLDGGYTIGWAIEPVAITSEPFDWVSA